jgi:hypothetical protein
MLINFLSALYDILSVKAILLLFCVQIVTEA